MNTKWLDIILGMNWLTHYDAIIYCGPRLTLYVDKSDSCLYALEGTATDIAAIPVVCEFPDFFLINCQGCHPIERSNLSLNLNPAQPLFPADLIECHQKSLPS